MLLIITTNNASHIAINIPTDVAEIASLKVRIEDLTSEE